MVQKLNTFHAFKPGSDIWFFPEKKNSYWLKIVDWYSHFLVSKMEAHKSQKMSQEVLAIIQNESLSSLPKIDEKNETTLVSVDGYIPSQSLVIIQEHSSVADFCEKILEASLKLKKNKIRVFLPSNVSFGQVQKNFQDTELEITVVEDEPQK